MKILIPLVLLTIAVYILHITSITSEVKSGKKILICNCKVVSPAKIVGFNDNTGYWTFTNGYARNCIIRTK